MKGFSLIELLTAVTAMTLISLIGVPWISTIKDQLYSQTDVKQLRRALYFGRNLAITHSKRITICPSERGYCVKDWNNALAIFEDINGNGELDKSDDLISLQGGPSPHGSWEIRSNNKGVITYFPEGFAFNSATTFLYCPLSGNNQYATQLVLNFQGRVKTRPYLSSNGSPYSSLGTLACPER